MTKWEYKITAIEENVHGHIQLDEAYLNELGQAGWELVGFMGANSVLKRPDERINVAAKPAPKPVPVLGVADVKPTK